MVDFKKLVKQKRDVDVKDLHSLFESLDRHTSHIELRPAQLDTLETLSTRRNEQDLILKISTGAGKTALGLIYLYSFMEELSEPVVYFCPTKQLAGQVVTESEKIGINAVIYPGGETYPHVDGTTAKSVIVCTYDKLFNAKTTFDRSDVMLRPSAIVLDDAHAGVEEIRDSFTLNIFGDELHEELISIFNESCIKFRSSVWRDILNGDPNQIIEIPFWLWTPLLPEVERAISEFSNVGEYKFKIPFLIDILRWCRCVISGSAIEIIPDILPVYKVDAFVKAKHRLFMSATLADDSVLVRELGCEVKAAKAPIIPSKDRGLGERMVLAPSLVDNQLDRSWVMSICNKLSKRFNVVVLTFSEKKGREWEPFGAEVFLGDQVKYAVEELQKNGGNLKFAVFVQRYDGVDLPDKSCRVLVLDGLPLGEGLIDKHDSSLNAIAGGTRNRLVYRIEQGMGRAVRSHADYAVVLLAGPEIAHFIAKHDVLANMNPDTKAQLQLAIELAQLAMEDNETDPELTVVDMIKKCLRRDGGWKQFYDESIRSVDRSSSGITESKRLEMANAERKAFESALANDFNKAVDIVREAINNNLLDDDNATGWYLQRVANYLHEIDPGKALEVQRTAYEKNKSMICPPGVVKRPNNLEKYDVQSMILNWLKEFENPNGAIAKIQELRAKLSFDLPPNTVEQAICDLAQLLGADGSRPEKDIGQGPDNLWLWPDLSLVIEAKTGNRESLHKHDAGQLLLSLQWFKEAYPTRDDPIPIIVAKIAISDKRSGFPDNIRIVTPDKMGDLLDALQKFYRTIIAEPIFYCTPKAIYKLQQNLKLAPEQFIRNFTVKLKEK
jgi:hypothetical protein